MSELQQLWQVTKDCYSNASLKTKALMAGGMASGLGFAGSTIIVADAVRDLTSTVAHNFQTGAELLTASSGDITQAALGTVFSVAALYAFDKSSNEAYLSLRSDLTPNRVKSEPGL